MPRASSAIIMPFKRPATDHRLTTIDRIEAMQWASSATDSGARLAFHRWADEEAPERGDYISIYRGEDCWAAWGAARCGQVVKIWRCATGVDLGHFPSMREALATLDFAARRQA